MPARSALRRAVSVALLVPAVLGASSSIGHTAVPHSQSDDKPAIKPPPKSTVSKHAAKPAPRPATKSSARAPGKGPAASASAARSGPTKTPASAAAVTRPPVARPPAPNAVQAGAPHAGTEPPRVKAVARAAPDRPGHAHAAAARDACSYTVKRGDSLGRIAARQGVSQASLISANHLPRSGAVTLGRRLSIPGCEAHRGAEPAIAFREGPTDGIMHARVGPRRVPTALHLSLPDFSNTMTTLLWPIAGPIASPFGLRRSGWHAGVDIKADVGTPILSAAAGTVIVSSWEPAYGRVVKIEHDDGFLTVYAHNLQNLVSAGDRVDAGQVIATVGRSGRSSAYHLHFEVRRDGMAYNPAHVLGEREVVVVRSGEPAETDTEEAEDEPAR